MAVKLLWQDPVSGRSILEALSTDTLPANEVTGTTVVLTDIGVIMTKMGDNYVPDLAARGGVARIREVNALAGTAVTLDYTAHPLRSATFFIAQEVAGTANLCASVAVCFNPLDDTARDIMLNAGNSLSADSGRILLPANTIFYRPFAIPVTHIGLKRNAGTETLSVIVMGISVG